MGCIRRVSNVPGDGPHPWQDKRTVSDVCPELLRAAGALQLASFARLGVMPVAMPPLRVYSVRQAGSLLSVRRHAPSVNQDTSSGVLDKAAARLVCPADTRIRAAWPSACSANPVLCQPICQSCRLAPPNARLALPVQLLLGTVLPS